MTRITLPAVLLLTFAVTTLSVADDKPTDTKAPAAKTPATAAKDVQKAETKTTETKNSGQSVVVDELITFGPTLYFYHSRNFYKQQDMKAAAAELTKAASMLDIAAGWDHGKMTKERLTKSAKDLREVAASLEKGEGVPTLKKLENAVAQAHVALAWHHFQAQGSRLNDIEGREANVAGHHLVAAGRYMEAAAEWAGRPLGTETTETVRKLNGLGSNLITLDTYRLNKSEPTVEKFARELKKLGTDIESGAKLVAK